MALEETPSRLAALRNEFALVIDYVNPDELDDFFKPYFHYNYIIEIRILFKNGLETGKQWIFRDEDKNTRFNAVFRQELNSAEIIEGNTAAAVTAEAVTAENQEPENSGSTDDKKITVKTTGFIEIYNEQLQISDEYRFIENGREVLTQYYYSGNILTRAVTRERKPGEEYIDLYTDTYRYNRSYFLRNIERVFHTTLETEPVFLAFPGRIMEMAMDKDLIKEKVAPFSDFIDDFYVVEDNRIIFETDNKGRILSQTMYDKDENIVWVIKNNWTGDRITSILKTEGESEKLTEFEYNSEGGRTVQRDINNGVLERQVFTDGNKDTEELFLNGVVVFRAFYENGRKISEERTRRR